MSSSKKKHIVLTSHPSTSATALKIKWGASTPQERGPIITYPDHKNCIGSHSGSYSIYRALAIASDRLDADHRPDFSHTQSYETIGPFPSWGNPDKIVSMDPFGADIENAFRDLIDADYRICPSIAITTANVNFPELTKLMEQGKLNPDGNVLKENGDCKVTKAAIEPVWYLPGIAKRFGIEESHLRRCLFEKTGGMYSELVTRPDLEVFLPPIGGVTVYIFGDVKAISDPSKELAVRVHDECNGSDVFGSDICTCRPYLAHGVEVCIETAQRGGAGVIAYNRKEGRALGEVTKFLVYNARRNQPGGDSHENYFLRTECVAGAQDMRFQELMPDVLHWLGIKRIDSLVS